MPFASEEEIRIAHDVLLKGKKPFDDQRKDIIKADNSCYVQACPGSGKTTTLLAKLLIIANRMPLKEGKGVCVLTHTNVAIDEIKAKVGPKADVLFKYPNYFGTIQTFLHKYVTAAALHYFYGSQITYVDDDVARAVLLKKYAALPFDNKLRSLVYAHIVHKDHILDDNTIRSWGGERALLEAKVIKKKSARSARYNFQFSNYDLRNIPANIITQINSRRTDIRNKEGKDIILSFKADWNNKRIITDNGLIGMSTESGREYVRIKEEIFKEGILSFEDAYDLGFRYIQEKELDFRSFSDKRFKYLFIDEVQDCNKQQVELIKKVFADDKVIVQCFGDYCQAIFDGDGSDGGENEELKGGDVLYIRNSNRFGERIARPLRALCMEDNNLLQGNEDVPSVKPVIITYEDPLEVLPKYVELLKTITIPEMDNRAILDIAKKEKEEDPLHRINIKACGWVGKKGASEQKRLIESYFPTFEKKDVKTRIEGDSFSDFLPLNPSLTVKDSMALIIQGILRFLDSCDVKNGDRRYTRTSLLDFLDGNGDDAKENFLVKVMSWTMGVARCSNDNDIQSIKDEIYQYMTETLLPLFGKVATVEANTFFGRRAGDGRPEMNTEKGNIFRGEGVDIEVATVHSVKGETHAATLYLETSYFGLHESERLRKQFKGNTYSGTDEKTLNSLKVVYVGMSRPRYLLCVAIQKDRFDAMDCGELREIWNVVEA